MTRDNAKTEVPLPNRNSIRNVCPTKIYFQIRAKVLWQSNTLNLHRDITSICRRQVNTIIYTRIRIQNFVKWQATMIEIRQGLSASLNLSMLPNLSLRRRSREERVRLRTLQPDTQSLDPAQDDPHHLTTPQSVADHPLQ